MYRLRTIRQRRGMTQAELAAKAHVGQGTVSKLERQGARRPAMATVRALAKALQINPLEIEFGLDPRSRKGPRGKWTGPVTAADREKTPPAV